MDNFLCHIAFLFKKYKRWLRSLKRPTILVVRWRIRWINLCSKLTKLAGPNEAILFLINKNDYHYESTWLHEASAGTLSPEQVRYDVKV